MENRARTLPLSSPIIDVNSYHAFSQSILLTDRDRALPWILSNYIHIFGVPDFNNGNFIHYATQSYFHELPYTFVSKLHTDQLKSWFPNGLQFFMDCLNHNQYIAIALDEYYIPGTHSFQQQHFVHHILIHGYDLDQRLFKLAGYFSKPPTYAFNKSVSFEQLEEALAHVAPVRQRISQTLEIIQYPYEDLCTVPFEFDTAAVLRSLEEHLQSKPMTEKNPKRIHFWFGLRAYDLLIRFIELELDHNQSIINMKSLQTLVNHKKLMLERTKFMVQQRFVTDEGLLAMSEELLNKTVILHHLFVKQRIAKDPRNMERAIKCIHDVKEYEEKFLERFINHLYVSCH
jgi:hypothetical protein